MKKATLILACALGWLLTPQGNADAVDAPFEVRNGNPFIAIFGLPQYYGVRPEHGFALRYNVASSYDGSVLRPDGGPADEQTLLDGETERLELSYKSPLGDAENRWHWGVTFPLVRHSGGYLDSLIIDWHDAFNLPQNGRDLARNNQLAYGFAVDDEVLVIDDTVSGIGDVQVTLDRRFGRDGQQPTLLRAHLKLPTGDSDKLFGSGGTDLALTLHQRWQMGQRWNADFMLGATFLGDGQVLAERVRPVVGHAGVKVAFRALDNLSLKVQWDVHSQVYEQTRLKQ